METKPAQNIQDSFINTARKDKVLVTIYLLSGVKLSGRIRSFDKYSVVLESNNQEQLIFKHAISTLVMGKAPHLAEARGEGRTAAAESQPTGKPAASASSSSSSAVTSGPRPSGVGSADVTPSGTEG